MSKHNKYLIYDYNYAQPAERFDIFPETEYLLSLTEKLQMPIIHFWQSSPLIILGLQDKQLTNLNAGLQLLNDYKYNYFVRNSGGLAVVSDPGVINLSLFLPNSAQISVKEAYLTFYELMTGAFPELDIQHGEAIKSYCPGDFDLVINGKKIAGLAQRRSENALVIMAYISIQGDQYKRGNLLQSFYELANTNNDSNFPDIYPDSMADLNQFMDPGFGIAEFKQRILLTFKRAKIKLALMSHQELMDQPNFTDFIYRRQRKQARLNASIFEENRNERI